MEWLAGLECFSWPFQDVLFHKGAPLWHACLNACVHVRLENSIYISLCKCLYFLSDRCLYLGYFRCVWSFFFQSPFYLNKMFFKKKDLCCVHYVICLEFTVDHHFCEEWGGGGGRGSEDTKSITTPISPFNVSHPNTYHMTDFLSPYRRHLQFRPCAILLLWFDVTSLTLN